MDIVALIVGLLLGLLVGVGAAWFVLRSRIDAARSEATTELSTARSDAAAARSEAAEARTQVAEARTQTAEARSHVESVRSDATRQIAEAQAGEAAVRRELSEVHVRLEKVTGQVESARAERDAMQREVEAERQRGKELIADRDALANQFRSLSQEILEAQSKKSEETAEQRLERTGQLLEPVAKALADLQERVTRTEKERIEMATELRGQVQTVQSVGRELRAETAALTSALGKPQIRGQWGELHLRRVVELAGMVEHCDFEVQVSATTDDGALRPDMQVRLTDDKFIYVDAKTSLAALVEADASDEDAYAKALTRYARHVKTHIDQLGSKKYWQLGTSTPEFVVMYLPTESALQLAQENFPDIFEYAADRKVIIATPMTLVALLRAVAFGWKQAALAESAAEVFSLGRELYERLGTMGGHFDRLGNELDSAVQQYNKTVRSLESRVFVTARKFRDLQVTEAALAELSPRREQPLSPTAPELVESTAVESERPDATQLPELRALQRVDPDIDDLVSELEPRTTRRRDLA